MSPYIVATLHHLAIAIPMLYPALQLGRDEDQVSPLCFAAIVGPGAVSSGGLDSVGDILALINLLETKRFLNTI
jgi:hypothetical protein